MIIVNNVMVMAYYEIGTIINQRKTWGNKYLQRLAIDLKGHSGMSLANLKRMSLIAKSFSYKEISSQPVSQIPWATLLTLIHKTSTHDELLWYANYTFINNFSRTDIEKEIKRGIYLLNKNLDKNNLTQVNLPIDNMFKDTYIIDYPGINKVNNEKELKDKLLDNIIVF